MTTPLYWKSWELSNKFYNSLLRYPFIAVCNTQTQAFTVEKNQVKLIPCYFSVFSLSMMILVFIILIAESMLSTTEILSQSIQMLYIDTVGSSGLAVFLVTLLFPQMEMALCTYWNQLRHVY